MQHMSVPEMRAYLERSTSSLNANKLHGMKAEASFRSYVQSLGASQRVSPGGWIFRQKGEQDFGNSTVAVFPHRLDAGRDYSKEPSRTDIPLTLHTICATMHQIGIRSFYAHPVISGGSTGKIVVWKLIQLGVPWQTEFADADLAFTAFIRRSRRYNYLRYNTDVSSLSDGDVLVQFSHENLRIFIEDRFMCETSDIDGIVWGERYTYPIEIKEKAPARDNDIGEWFGLDTGPFVKLAHYAARRGNLHSLFVVREIEDPATRTFKRWLFTEFDKLAQYASWVPRSGGQSMGGSRSMVVRIPRTAFRELDAKALEQI